MMRPIEIIGGGLAGLSLGLALRRADASVTVVEAGAYPRHRVCGEFIAGLSEATIRRLGLVEILAGARRHSEVAWFMRERPIRAQHLPAPALGLSRYMLDARLAEAFAAAGGILRTGIRAADEPGLPGRVIATGRRRSGRSPWLGLKVHVQGPSLVRDLELHIGDNAYVGLAGVEEGRVNICGIFRRRSLSAQGVDLMEAYLRASGLGSLAVRLKSAAVDTASFCAVAALPMDRRVTADNGVRLGDGCGMIAPFTGDGMAMAFQSAEIALGPLLAYASGEAGWDETVQGINGSLRRRFRVRLASAQALHPFFLRPARQRWLSALNRVHLLPLRPLYALVH